MARWMWRERQDGSTAVLPDFETAIAQKPRLQPTITAKARGIVRIGLPQPTERRSIYSQMIQTCLRTPIVWPTGETGGKNSRNSVSWSVPNHISAKAAPDAERSEEHTSE